MSEKTNTTTKTAAQWREEATSTSQFAAPLAAGTYLVGDPCHAFDNSLRQNWLDWLADAWKEKDVDPNRLNILDGCVKGMRIAASRTAYGDGEYYDQDKHIYGVDAGLLGAVPVELLATICPGCAGMAHEQLEAEIGMRVVEFPHPFHVSFDEDSGIVSIGHIVIK